MAAMKEPQSDPLETALNWCAEGRAVALATVVRTWGSAPQPVGSRLVVDAEENFEGSVSGGCVEGAVITEALDILQTGKPRLLTFGVSDDTAFDAGLACGGTIAIFVEPVGGTQGRANLEFFAAIAAERAARRPVIATTALDGGTHRFVRPGDAGEQGALASALEKALAGGVSEVVEGPDGDIFVEVHHPALRLVIVGAVHIAQHLAPSAAAAGFAVTIIDPRQAFATPARFPGARLFTKWPDEMLPDYGLDARTAMTLLTHDPKIDDVALKLALESDCFYIGALGSRRTHAARCERLAEAGFSEQRLERIHAPIGLPIGARGPAEIAISILAQLILVLRLGA